MGAFRLLWAGAISPPHHEALTAAGIVASGESLLEAMRLSSELELDAAVLNFDSLGAEGLGLLRHLRSRASNRHLPVLIFTDRASPELRLDVFASGGDDLVSSEIRPEELLARVFKGLSLRQRIDGLLNESQRLHELSLTDALTMVPNHRHFQERLKDEFRRAHRYDDALALLMIDLDHFKKVNDELGHVAGDVVLRDCAAAIQHSVRETDFVARYGGEEFVVLLPKTQVAGALTVAERVWQDVGKLKTGPDRSVRVTASVGVSGFPGRGVSSAEALVRTADEALYRAKREGRNKISLHQPMLADVQSA